MFVSDNSGSFWASGLSANPIDDLLAKSDVLLEELLDDETCIQEVTAHNTKLIEFLQQPDVLHALLGYMACTDVETFRALSLGASQARAKRAAAEEGSAAGDGASTGGSGGEDDGGGGLTDDPSASASLEAANAASLVVDDEDEEGAGGGLDDEELEEERSMKFPYVACEILCCNLTELIEVLVGDASLLGKLFEVLERAAPLDSRVSGYFYKVMTVLLRRAPETVLWFSVYRNLSVSAQGKQDSASASGGSGPGVGWLMPLLLRHIDSYSIMCCFKTLLQVAAEDSVGGEDEDEDGRPQGGAEPQGGNLDRHRAAPAEDGADGGPSDEERNALMREVRSIWLGGSGAALEVLAALDKSDNSDSHSNAAELLADMIQRAAMSRLQTGWFQQVREQQHKERLAVAQAQSADLATAAGVSAVEADEALALAQADVQAVEEEQAGGVLPKFSGMVLVSSGHGPMAEAVMIESGCEWSLKLCEELMSVALFDNLKRGAAPAAPSPPPAESSSPTSPAALHDGEEFNRIVERGSAAIASLQVLTHLVSAFALERWADPGEVVAAAALSQGAHGGHPGAMPAAPITSMETHGELPPELGAILARLPDIVKCLTTERHMELFGVSRERAERFLGIHRLKIVELICMLIHTKYPEAIKAIAQLDEAGERGDNAAAEVADNAAAEVADNAAAEVADSPGMPVAADERNALGLCMDLFFRFEWNNCLHSVLERTLQFVFLGGVSEESMGFDAAIGLEDDEDDEDDEDEEGGAYARRVRMRQEEIAREQNTANRALLPLHVSLFGQCRLVDRLLWAYQDNRRCIEAAEEIWQALEAGQSGEARKQLRSAGHRGYMGFCHRIVNTVALLAASQRNERDQLAPASADGDSADIGAAAGATTGPSDDSGEAGSDGAQRWPALAATEHNAPWAELLQGELACINEVERSMLGGERPRSYSTPGSDGMGPDIGNDMDDDFSNDMMLHDGKGGQFLDIEDSSVYKEYVASYSGGGGDDDSDSGDDEFDLLAAESAAEDELAPPGDQAVAEALAQSFEKSVTIDNGDDDFDPFGATAAGGATPSASAAEAAPAASAAPQGDADDFDPFGDSAPKDQGSSAPLPAAAAAPQAPWEPDFGD